MNFKLKATHNKPEADSDGKAEELDNPLATLLSLPRIGIPEGFVEVERYPLNPPFCYATIALREDTAEHLYIVDELLMDRNEAQLHHQLCEILEKELKALVNTQAPNMSFQHQLPQILEKHERKLSSSSPVQLRKALYYVERDIVGFSRIDSLMHDPAIEDISCGGVGKPVFIWHKKYESIRTTISFDSEQSLDDLVIKLIHRGGKHVSTAFPIVDATLPGKHRLSVLYRKEVTPLGTSFTIRKFRADPYTIVDLIAMGALNDAMAAYFWLLMENKRTLMILGATGAGKTTALNAISLLIQPATKLVTVEEVTEMNLPHENWFTLVSRSGFGLEREGEISLFELIKSAVRHRPDFIIVGEVRGEEVYVLFQALATGHGGLCTMHADSVGAGLMRLTQKPMNVPPSSITLMNCAIVVKRVQCGPSNMSGKRFSRRFVQVSEILDANSTRDIFVWNPAIDLFLDSLARSELLKKISESNNIPPEALLEELERRRVVLRWMSEEHKRDYRTVSQIIGAYHIYGSAENIR